MGRLHHALGIGCFRDYNIIYECVVQALPDRQHGVEQTYSCRLTKSG